jgi:hypothetical protein
MRQAPNLKKLQVVTVCGLPRKASPATRQEMIEAGFVPAEMELDYVEPTKKSSFYKAALYNKNSHVACIGIAGTGKDVFVECLGYKLNRPVARFAFKIGANPADAIARVELVVMNGGTATVVTDGDLTRASKGLTIKRDLSGLTSDEYQDLIDEMVEEEYTVVELGDGLVEITIPPIILFSDYDRALPEQMETLRQALEIGKEKLVNPVTGMMFSLVKGVRFYLTGNSGIDGDGGRGNHYRGKDSSMATRLSAVYVAAPDEKFEVEVLAKSQPTLSREEIELIVKCSRALRQVCEESRLGLEVTLRQSKMWARHALTLMQADPSVKWADALRETLGSIVDHFVTDSNRSQLEGAIDVFLRSNLVEEAPSETICPIDME